MVGQTSGLGTLAVVVALVAWEAVKPVLQLGFANLTAGAATSPPDNDTSPVETVVESLPWDSAAEHYWWVPWVLSFITLSVILCCCCVCRQEVQAEPVIKRKGLRLQRDGPRRD